MGGQVEGQHRQQAAQYRLKEQHPKPPAQSIGRGDQQGQAEAVIENLLPTGGGPNLGGDVGAEVEGQVILLGVVVGQIEIAIGNQGVGGQ